MYERARGGDSHLKRAGCSSYLLGIKKAVLVPLGCSASKVPQQELS